MIRITPDSTIELTHRAFHVAASRLSRDVVALTPEGSGSAIRQGRVHPFTVRGKPNQIALDPTGTLLAVTTDRALMVVEVPTGVVLAMQKGSFQGCEFSHSGDNLWVSRRLSKEASAIELRGVDSLHVRAQVTIADRFGDSFFMLFPNPATECVSVWAAAGQDGQALFWVQALQGTLRVVPFAALDETSPPDFAANGTSFLVIAEASELQRYAYPEGTLLGTVPWPFDDEVEQIGDTAVFVDSAFAIVESNEDRLYVVDLTRGVVADELVIAGHEPRPVHELYPTLKNESGLSSDFSFLLSLGHGHFVSIHQSLPSSGDEWRDQVVAWRFDGDATRSV